MKYTVESNRVICEGNWPTKRGPALRESIKKWQAIVLFLENNKKNEFGFGERGPGVGEGECALCHIYNSNPSHYENSNDCVGCPVYEKTGQKYCEGTSYETYMDSDN